MCEQTWTEIHEQINFLFKKKKKKQGKATENSFGTESTLSRLPVASQDPALGGWIRVAPGAQGLG